MYDRQDRRGTRSARPDLRMLLSQAKRQLRAVHASKIWLECPFACVGTSDYRKVQVEVDKLAQLAATMGRKLVGIGWRDRGIEEPVQQDLESQIGHTVIRQFFADLIRDQDVELEFWRSGSWFELYQAGKLRDDELEYLVTNHPGGNPWHT